MPRSTALESSHEGQYGGIMFGISILCDSLDSRMGEIKVVLFLQDTCLQSRVGNLATWTDWVQIV